MTGDPGNGANEKKAKEMFAALENIKSERPPNT